MFPRLLAVALWVGLASCTSEPDPASTEDSGTEADTDTDTDSDTDTDTEPLSCGDGVCDTDEDCGSCPIDCGVCAQDCIPDGWCDGASGTETCTSCPADCETDAVVCGNGACQAGEDSVSCPADCGPDPWPAEWLAWEQEVIVEMNAHRAAGTSCPSGPKAVVGPLQADPQLQRAAQLHSWDQSYADYFAHTSCDGRSPWERAAAAGGAASAENIAWGYASPEAVVSGWMSSTAGHCDSIMSPNYGHVGIGYADIQGRLWTAKFR